MRVIDGMITIGVPTSAARAFAAERCCRACATFHKLPLVPTTTEGHCYICEQPSAIGIVGELVLISQIKPPEIPLRAPSRNHMICMVQDWMSHGQMRAIILNRKNQVLDGNLRLQAALRCGLKSIIVRYV